MTVKIDEEMIVELIKGYFQDHKFEPFDMETGDMFNFNMTFKCVEGVKFILTDIQIPKE